MLLLLDAPPVSFRSRNCSSRLLCGCPGASLTCAVIALFVSCYESTSWLALFAVSVLLSLPLFCWSWFVSLIAEVKLLSLSESALHPDREYVCGCVSVCLSVVCECRHPRHFVCRAWAWRRGRCCRCCVLDCDFAAASRSDLYSLELARRVAL